MPGRSKAVFVLVTAAIAAFAAAGCAGKAGQAAPPAVWDGKAAAGTAVEPEAIRTSTDWYTADPEAKTFSISAADELAALAKIVNGEDGFPKDNFHGKTVRLAADIDLSRYDNWTPVGNYAVDANSVFSGTLDGGGNVIKNLTINRPNEDYQGLFGSIAGGTVKNLGVENMSVSAGNNAGGIAGYVNNAGSISNCHTTGKISGREKVGGIAGYVWDRSSITNCYSAATVSASNREAGGLAGRVLNSFIANSYAAGDVSGRWMTGGLVGLIAGNSESAVTGCYSTGAVSTENRADKVGGLIGFAGDRSRILNCAALGPEVKNFPAGRVVGEFEYFRNLEARISNNAAWAGMKNSSGNVGWFIHPKGPAAKNGKGITTEEIKADATMGGRFTAKNGWTIENGKLPGLRGKAVEMPAYLKAVVYRITGPDSASVPLGGARRFTATVFGIEQADKSVTWTVTGNTSDSTVISDDGLLNVGRDETAADITVTATAAADTGFSAAARVEIDTNLHVSTRWYADNHRRTKSFTISTAGELAGLAQIVNGTAKDIARDDFGGKTIKLIKNIDLSAYKNWTPIGNYAVDRENVFSGTFDGGGHVISRLTVKAPYKAPYDGSDSERCWYGRVGYQGLFGYIRGGGVENLGLERVDILGGKHIGGIAGVITDRSYIANSYSSGKVKGVRHPVGGVAGWVDDHSDIANSYSSGIVSGCGGTGGVAGNVSKNSCVANSYSTAEVINSSEDGFSGGVAGSVSGNSVVTNCYFAGKFNAGFYGAIGGVAGEAANNSKITDCAALNYEIFYSGKNTHEDGLGCRIVGYDSNRHANSHNYKNPTLSNNAAWAGMKNRYINDYFGWPNKGANRRDGAGITIAQIKADGTLGGRFIPENGWTIENGKLPGLRGKAVELPRHLR